MQNIYVYLWGALALLMFVAAIRYLRKPDMRTTGAAALGMGLFFVFLTVWYGLRTFGSYAMFEGTLGVVFRVILGVVLAAIVAFYLIIRKRRK